MSKPRPGWLFCAVLVSAQAQIRPADRQVKQLKVTILSTMLADEGIGEWRFAALVEADGRRRAPGPGPFCLMRAIWSST
jgi:hypothetical protein